MKQIILLLIILPFFFSCSNQIQQENADKLSWTKNAVMYEVNVRQFTPEGTFNAFSKHLTRIKELGVDIIWFMPIHEIGQVNRKGSLGSYYSVKDYRSINPEFGTLEDFNQLVKQIHELDMKVIIDWVANHTSFDNVWVQEGNLDWYNLDSLGNLQPPNGTDWWDVADLNYENREMQNEMVNAMKFWLTESDIDGFRCDVADWVPVSFWDSCRIELDKVKDVFMLAEAENPELHNNAFDMTYAWEAHFIMNEIANGKKSAKDLIENINKNKNRFPKDAYRLHFTSNHDENSWKGYAEERLGPSLKTMNALVSVIEGMPLIYGGQESNLQKRLRFFEKDTIEWKNYELTQHYQALFDIKKKNKALWNGNYGGEPIIISQESEDALVIYRTKDEHELVLVFNLSQESIDVKLNKISSNELFYSLFSGQNEGQKLPDQIQLKAWEYHIYSNIK